LVANNQTPTTASPGYPLAPFTSAQAAAIQSLVSGVGGTVRADVPNSTVPVNSFLRMGFITIPGGSMGRNGEAAVTVMYDNITGNNATYYVTFMGSPVYATAQNSTGVFTFTLTNTNTTQHQWSTLRSNGTAYEAFANTDADAYLELWVQKANAADVVRIRKFDCAVRYNNKLSDESTYFTAAGPFTVSESDLLLPSLPARVTSDPQKAIRALTTTPYAFPAKFFACADLNWPVNSSTPTPFANSLIRSQDFQGSNWPTIQTAQATTAYTGVTGAAPAGISAAGLAKLDTCFAAAAATNGATDMMVSLMTEFSVSAPAWMTALGGTNAPLSIPAAGANRTALLASLGYYVQFLCQRYTSLYPSMTWFIEPLNEPNTTGIWSGIVADFVALTGTIRAAVNTYGGGKVFMVSSSWTDKSGISFLNAGSPGTGGTKQTLHEYIGGGGWGHIDVLSYHLYGGTVWAKDTNTGNPYWQQSIFSHILKYLDPLNDGTNGTYTGIPAMLNNAGVGQTVVPGVSLAGKPFWITESGEAYPVARDKNFFIRLALICSALGVSKYNFYAYASNTPALASMNLSNCIPAIQAAQQFLAGKTINWVNANNDLSKVGASINGVVYQF
jgi:hypothetical protein